MKLSEEEQMEIIQMVKRRCNTLPPKYKYKATREERKILIPIKEYKRDPLIEAILNK